MMVQGGFLYFKHKDTVCLCKLSFSVRRMYAILIGGTGGELP